jgi:hypothetical protein
MSEMQQIPADRANVLRKRYEEALNNRQQAAVDAGRKFIVEADESTLDGQSLVRLAELDDDCIDGMSFDEIVDFIEPGLPACDVEGMWSRYLDEPEPSVDECRGFLRGACETVREVVD